MNHSTRRQFLQTGAAVSFAGLFPTPWLSVVTADEKMTEKLPVAAIVTEYRTNSHADVIVGKILEGFRQDGGQGPGLKLVSMYTDQVPENDLSRQLAEKHGFRLTNTIDEALTLGTNQIQVAGVLSIGEHGKYPLTPDTKQQMYPRRRFFDEIVAAFRRCGKVVPVFNDKHLGYLWNDAKFMVEVAREMEFPLLAGSSVPVAWRMPVLDLPLECEIEAAVTIGYGGLEAYGFHALEAHQAMIERRRGGETGVDSVQVVAGNGIREAQRHNRWSKQLFDAALSMLPGSPKDHGDWTNNDTAAAYLLQHQDGLKSAVIMANGLTTEFATAVKFKDRSEPLATWFKLQPGAPFAHFAYLVQAIEHTFRTGKTAYPVERTLLTTGILDRVMQSVADGGALMESPELGIRYRAVDCPFANHPKSQLNLPND